MAHLGGVPFLVRRDGLDSGSVAVGAGLRLRQRLRRPAMALLPRICRRHNICLATQHSAHQTIPIPPGRISLLYQRRLSVHLGGNAVLFGALIFVLIGLLELGASEALNAILGSSVLCIFASYLIPIVTLIPKRKALLPEGRYFNLGRYRVACNVIASVWMAYEFVWLTFPDYLPVDASNMNYSVSVLGAVFLIALINWVCYSKRVYKIPVVRLYVQDLGILGIVMVLWRRNDLQMTEM